MQRCGHDRTDEGMYQKQQNDDKPRTLSTLKTIYICIGCTEPIGDRSAGLYCLVLCETEGLNECA